MTERKSRNSSAGWEKKGYTPAPVPASKLPAPKDAGPSPSSVGAAGDSKKT